MSKAKAEKAEVPTYADVYGWTITEVVEEGMEIPAVIIAKGEAGERWLRMEYQPGTPPDVIREYAGSRALEADVEDAARAALPGTDHRAIITALYTPPPGKDGPLESDAIKTIRDALAGNSDVQDRLELRNGHVAMSRELQVQRGKDRDRAANESHAAAVARFNAGTEG